MAAPGSVAVIVGASRGLGLELARIYLAQSNLHVVALSRSADGARKAILDTKGQGTLYVHRDPLNGNGSKPNALDVDAKDSSSFDGKRLTTLDVDLLQEDSIASAGEQVRKQFGEGSLRLLFNVAGILRVSKNVQQTSYEDLLEQFRINTFAPLLTAKHFTPLLPRRLELGDKDDAARGLLPKNTSVIANMSARVGSIGDNHKGGWYGYRASKAAQNQITRTLSIELGLRKAPAIAVGLHPGTVRTELSAQFTGGPGGGSSGSKESDDERRARGEFEANEAASQLAHVVANLTPEQSGFVWDYAGKQVPF